MKKVLVGLIGVLVVVMSVPLFAAFEAHVINVTAHIENALRVLPLNGELTFGTVFPQEYLQKKIWVTTSTSFCQPTQRRVTTIEYKIVQKPKCINGAGQYAPVDYATDECPDGYTEMPSLCQYLSKTPENDIAPYTDRGVLAFHDPSVPASIARGIINKDYDLSDEWIIDLPVPCFRGQCAQDWPEFVHRYNANVDPSQFELDPALDGKTFGCDLWVEVTGFKAPGENPDPILVP